MHTALARLTPEHVRSALGLVRTGTVYDLGLEINERMPQGARGQFVPFSRAFSTTPAMTARDGIFSFSTEVVIGTLHTSTHIDAFIHVQADGRVFGDLDASEARSDQGWRVHGVETIAPIVGRCVLLDVAGVKGVPLLPDGYEVTIADLVAAAAATGLSVESGDIVLVRTGKLSEFSDPERFQAGEPGVGREAAIWLYEQGMSVLATDTTGTEPLPFADPRKTTHAAMLVERGVHLIENVFLDDLARDGVAEAAFICTPLKLTGCTGSWVRPIAIA
jgi:kynurenine formamidase